MATQYATVTLPTVESTQDEARRLALGGEPTLVVAARQVAGRGRVGRTWWEAPRALYSSLAFRPGWPRSAWTRLPLVAGLAVRGALSALTATTPGLKWPNDLVTEAGKLGGILTESVDDLVVVGCGVNLWWPEAPPDVAAACGEDPGAEFAALLGAAWAEDVLSVVEGDPDDWGRERYRDVCVTLGTEVTWDPDGAGRATGIAADGSLIVESGGAQIHLRTGEVRSVRPTTVAAEDTVDTGDDAE